MIWGKTLKTLNLLSMLNLQFLIKTRRKTVLLLLAVFVFAGFKLYMLLLLSPSVVVIGVSHSTQLENKMYGIHKNT